MLSTTWASHSACKPSTRSQEVLCMSVSPTQRQLLCWGTTERERYVAYL